MPEPLATDVLIVGAGQAGLSLSRELCERRVEHVVLERGRIGESWRSQRWDSFCLVTPNWTVRLARDHYAGPDPDGFMGKTELIAYFEHYATSASLPVHTGVTVTSAAQRNDGWQVTTAHGQVWHARVLVVATATHQKTYLPKVQARCHGAHHVHAADYRSPAALPTGDVLVVGSGQSGVQIAEELAASGRNVTLATSRVGRIPRRYRGRDVIEWQREMGFLDRHADVLDTAADRFRADPMLSGYDGGHTVDLRDLAARGINLSGTLREATGGQLKFADNLAEHVHFADAFSERLERTVDKLIDARGLHAPPAEPSSSKPMPVATHGARIAPGAIEVIVWATGFTRDLSWLPANLPVDESGYPAQRNWQSGLPHLHFLGFNYLEHRRSGILYGAGVEAHALANVLTGQS